MRKLMFATLAVIGWASSTPAQSIENACLRSDHAAKSRQLCGCIQQAANLTLTPKDQNLASTFYGDPQKAQDVRQSHRFAHEKFWDRYKQYAETARTFCS